jgi:hypothetical protein
MVLLLGPFSIALIYSDEIFETYVRAEIAPQVQNQFGFRMVHKNMYYRQRQRLDVFLFTALEPDGVLAKAGVRNNDIPLGGLLSISDINLYRRLYQGRKEAVELRLIGCDEYEDWLREDKFSLFDRTRRVVIPQQ